jgi:hypothetical protein
MKSNKLTKDPVIITLTLTYITKILLHLRQSFTYLYDETLLTSISTQPTKQLLHTIKAEPHGPLFYFFLKLFPIQNPNLTRTLLITLSYFLIFIAYLFLKKQKLSNAIKWGLALFFCTNAFILQTYFIKQNIIALPINLWIIILSITILNKPKNKNITKWILTSHFLSLTLLPLSYIPYMTSVFVLFGTTMMLKNNKTAWISWIPHTIITTLYLTLFGAQQIYLNRLRFPWFEDFNNSLIEIVSLQLTGASIRIFATDLVILTFMFLVITGLLSLIKNTKEFHFKFFPLIYLSALYTLTLYQFQFFTQDRYSVYLLLLLCLLAGYKIKDIKKPKKFKLALYSVFLISGLNFIIPTHLEADAQYHILTDTLSKKSQDKTFGLTSDVPLFNFTLKQNYFPKNNHIIPVHPLRPNLLKNSHEFTQELLMLDALTINHPKEEIKQLLTQNNLQNYFYITSIGKHQLKYFDKNYLLLEIFEESCQTHQLLAHGENDIIMAYENCSFE